MCMKSRANCKAGPGYSGAGLSAKTKLDSSWASLAQLGRLQISRRGSCRLGPSFRKQILLGKADSGHAWQQHPCVCALNAHSLRKIAPVVFELAPRDV
uniref:Uncharacterized protein n=1 Tax=Sphaerodactylus townsendi TaxID=933632 RepID=A0ACB8FFM9_9SAUR